MREIKFRVWDKKRNTFEVLTPLVFLRDEDHIGYFRVTSELIDGSNYDDNIVLMQFTGLHDKNGKEIYEGDIVKRTFSAYFNTCVRCNEELREFGPAFHEVVYYKGRFTTTWERINREANATVTGTYSELEDSEVIGNIYENPDQLK